jgi:diacylglycerol kinase (ATP)
MRVLILVNAHAGSANRAASLREAVVGHTEVTLQEPRDHEELKSLAAAAWDAGYGTIAAAGGDGTVHAVINALAGHFDRARVGIIPLGTGNDLCRTLAIPPDPREALRVLQAGAERRIDLVQVETGHRRLFCVNVAAGGFTGQMQELLTDEVKAWWGPLAYLRGAASVLPNLTGYHTQLRLDDGPIQDTELINLIVANGRMAGGGLNVAPRANPEDGLLNVVSVRYAPLLDLTQVAALLLAGDYLSSEQVIHRVCRRLQVSSTPGMCFSVDGELFSSERMTFTVQPHALRIVVGPDYSPTGNPLS